MITLEDIKLFDRCERLLFYYHNDQSNANDFIYYSEDINKLSMQKLKIDNYFIGSYKDSNAVSKKQLNKYQAGIAVCFSYNDFKIKIPVVVASDKGYDLYFTYNQRYPKEIEAQYIADCLWVLNKINIKYNSISLIHINSNYVYKENLDVDELLVVSSNFYNNKNQIGKSIDELIVKKKRNVSYILRKIRKILTNDSIEALKLHKCSRKQRCPYYKQCFNNYSDTHILNLVESQKKYQLFNDGILDIKDINFDDIEGTMFQFIQYNCAKNNQQYINKEAIKQSLSSVKYPIAYLDFEWETFAYPPYEQMKPFDVLCFEYSLHIEYEDGTLVHKSFLGHHDCRKALIKQLLSDLPKEGTIMCYNVVGAEKLRLKEFARWFNEYKEAIESLYPRLYDLSLIFNKGLIYDNKQAGSSSLKKVVSAYTKYSYDDLEIIDGVNAVREYMKLEKDNYNNLELEANLKRYCGMDTYSEYLLYHYLIDAIKEDE